MKHAFFFGAGASAYFGMPVTKEMLDWFEGDEFFAMLQKKFKNNNNFKDIEEFYTFLDRCSSKSALFLLEHDDKSYNLLTSTELIEKCNDYKKEVANHLIQTLDPSTTQIESYQKCLIKLHEIGKNSQLKIITTNYDLLIDKCFNDRLNGFRFINSNTIQNWDGWVLNTDKPIVLKLHGSINFSSQTNQTQSTIHDIAKSVDSNENPIMLPLTLDDKDYTIEPCKTMFEKFEFEIPTIDLLIVIGYTFRDRKIREMIQKHLDQNLRILLIDPNAHKICNEFTNSKSVILDESKEILTNNYSRYNLYCYKKEFKPESMNSIVSIADKILELIETNRLN